MQDYDIGKSKRNKGVLAIESRLNELVATDPRNEEIYHLLKQLAGMYINQNKFIYGYNGIEEVCHDVAADVWMSVLQGRKIYAWMYYIGKMIKLSYVPKQKYIEHETIETDGDPVLKESVKRMCASSSMSCTKDFDDMQRNLMLDNIGGIIQTTMSNTKFKQGTKEYLSVYTNVCLNLINDIEGKEFTYFRMPSHLKPFVNIIIEQFKKDFRNSGFTESIMDNVEDDLELQLTSDEVYMKERKNRNG